MISLIAFLGNIGTEYEWTRHNAAWIIADQLAICTGITWQRKFRGQYGRLSLNITQGKTVHVVKPVTYMNLSGDCVGEAAQFFKIPASEILVVHDELELPPATISLKWAGGLGGHNGLRSIRAALGTSDFWRLRIGIGRPDNKKHTHGEHEQHKPDIASYVLSPFSHEEINLLSTIVPDINALFSLLCIDRKDPETLLKTWSKINIVDAKRYRGTAGY